MDLIDDKRKVESMQGSGDYSKTETLDEILDLSHFPFLDTQLADKPTLRKSIRLLYIFGVNGQNALFVTNEDICYAFGNNHFGCLGYGSERPITTEFKVIPQLSKRQVIDICSGVEHCLALLEEGRCYLWGNNQKGQLGVEAKKLCYTPLHVKELTEKKVIQISCGAYHSMALTDEREIYSWGWNKYGQLGVGHYNQVWIPTALKITSPISFASISCGRNHSLGLTDDGIAYLWGFNEFGQLGKPKEVQWKAPQPFCNPYIKLRDGNRIIKAVCGSDHTFLLTNDGFVYGFGENSSGQVGNGSTNTQFLPIKINDWIRFKDIIANTTSKLTIGISSDGKYYVWGSVDGNKVLVPKLIFESKEESVFDVYAKYASKKTTFKTIVINHSSKGVKTEEIPLNQQIIISDIKVSTLSGDNPKNSLNQQNIRNENSIQNSNSSNALIRAERVDCLKYSIPKQENGSEISTVCDNHSIRSSILSTNPSNTLQNYMIQSFNNPKNSDLKFISEDKTVYCHKTVLKIRNQKFWEVVNKRLSEQNSNEIQVETEYYEPFYAFLQYLYGIEPIFNDKIVSDLQSMAGVFDEKDLLDECSQYIEALENTPNLSNVCTLYQKAINEGLNDLQSSCIEFAANHWKAVLKTEDFQAMDESVAKRLILTVLVIDH